MTEQEFKNLQLEVASSGKTLKDHLRERGISYSTYNYWRRKCAAESRPMPMAPITIRQSAVPAGVQFAGTGIPGVTLAFPNGLRAHFGEGSEEVLMEVFNQSLSHVLPQ